MDERGNGGGPAAPVEVTALGSTYRFLADGGTTEGRYSLCEETFFGDPPPLHVHDGEDEAFYVLDGRGVVVVGDVSHAVGPGSHVHVPRGTPHTLHRTTEAPLRMLTVVSPAGFEQFFVEVADVLAAEPDVDDDRIAAIAARYGCRFVDPTG